MNSTETLHKLLVLMGMLSQPVNLNNFFINMTDDDYKFVDDQIVQNAILNFEINLLKYTYDSLEENLTTLYNVYLNDLSLMTEEEAEYFKMYCENLVNSMGTYSENIELGSQKKRRKEKYE